MDEIEVALAALIEAKPRDEQDHTDILVAIGALQRILAKRKGCISVKGYDGRVYWIRDEDRCVVAKALGKS